MDENEVNGCIVSKKKALLWKYASIIMFGFGFRLASSHEEDEKKGMNICMLQIYNIPSQSILTKSTAMLSLSLYLFGSFIILVLLCV